jgi:hypothetical protein
MKITVIGSPNTDMVVLVTERFQNPSSIIGGEASSCFPAAIKRLPLPVCVGTLRSWQSRK